MPYFSFSVKDNNTLLNDFAIKPNKVYFSKSNSIWKSLNKEKRKNLFSINRERREKLNKIGNNVLFFLPPNIGLGDALEYASALQQIKKNNIFKKIGIAFTESYSFVFKNYFNLKDIYPHIISSENMKKYDSLFHLTLEIDPLIKQKYVRSNIEKEIKNFFKIKDTKKLIGNNKNNNKSNKKIKKFLSSQFLIPQ